MSGRNSQGLRTLGATLGGELAALTGGPLPDLQKLDILEQFWPEVLDALAVFDFLRTKR